MNRTNTLRKAAAFFLLSSFSAFAQPITTSDLSPYNALIFGDFMATISRVDGNAAVGGNLNTVDYSFGVGLNPTEAVGTDVLTVQGDTTMTRGRVYHGDLVHEGTNVLAQTGVDGTIRRENVLDFAAAQARYSAFSESLSNLEETGTASSAFNKLSLIGDPSMDVNLSLIHI